MNKAYLLNPFRWKKCGSLLTLSDRRNRPQNLLRTNSGASATEIGFAENDLSFQSFSELSATADGKAKIVSIVAEYQEARKNGKRVPTSLNVEQMKELMFCDTKHQRMKYLLYLSRKERKRISSLEKQEKRRVQEENSSIERSDDSKPVLNLYNIYFLRHVRKVSARRFHNLRLAHAALFGQKLVIDLDYDAFMLRKEIQNCVKQLALVFASNKRDRNPFDLYVCNVKPESHSLERLKKDVPRFGQDDCLDTFTESSYMDLFPREKLIYLSPHAEETMTEYDPSAIYIIGAFVDLSTQWKMSHEKAEQDGIHSLSLPLDEYLNWHSGSKCLAINQVFEILLKMKNTRDWKTALSVVPKRKCKQENQKDESSKEQPDSELLQQIEQ